MRISTAGMHRTQHQRHPRAADASWRRRSSRSPRASDSRPRPRIRSPRRAPRGWTARSRTTRSTRAIRTSSRAASATKNRRWRTSPRCCRARATRRCRAPTPRSAQSERKHARQRRAAASRGLHGHRQPPGRQRRISVRRHVDRARVPFAQGATGVNYQGDQTNRQIRISSTQSLADGHTGADVFMGIAERNGVFRTTCQRGQHWQRAPSTWARVTNPTAWVPDNYTLQFTSATDWQVVDDTHADRERDREGRGIHVGAEHQFPRRDGGDHRHAGRERQFQRSARAADRCVRHAGRARGDARGLRAAIGGSVAVFQARDRRRHHESRPGARARGECARRSRLAAAGHRSGR